MYTIFFQSVPSTVAEWPILFCLQDKKEKKVALKLKYKIQKSVGEQVNFTTLTAEGMTLTIQPRVGDGVSFTYTNGMYGLEVSGMTYEEIPDNSYVVTLTKGGNIVDQRIVPITFKPKLVFDIDTENGKLTSRIETTEGRVSSFEQDIKKTQITVGKLDEQYSQIRQTAKEIAIEQISKTTGRDNLLVGSAFRNENEIKWYFKTDPTHHKCLISRTVNCLGTNSVMIESTSTKENYLGVAFWGIQVNAGGKYNLSCQIYKEAGVDAGTIGSEVKCYRKDKSRATVFKPPLNIISAEDDKWTLNQTDFAVGDDVDYIDVFFWVEKAGKFYLARPMLREGEGYTKWSLSQFDYGYVGGNMLDGTKNFDGAHINVNKGSKGSNDGYVTEIHSTKVDEYFLSWYYDRGLLKTDTDYVLSFVAKGAGDVGVTIFGGDNKTVFSEGGDGAIIPYDETPYGEQRFTLTRDFRKYWVRIRTSKSFDDATQRGFRTYSDGARIELYNVKLEEGATDTAYTDSTEKLMSEDLFMRAGIYLREGRIDMQADKFTLRNNAGEDTLGVDENGNLLVTGTVRATNFYQNVEVITTDTLSEVNPDYNKPNGGATRITDIDRTQSTADMIIVSGDFGWCINTVGTRRSYEAAPVHLKLPDPNKLKWRGKVLRVVNNIWCRFQDPYTETVNFYNGNMSVEVDPSASFDSKMIYDICTVASANSPHRRWNAQYMQMNAFKWRSVTMISAPFNNGDNPNQYCWCIIDKVVDEYLSERILDEQA